MYTLLRGLPVRLVPSTRWPTFIFWWTLWGQSFAGVRLMSQLTIIRYFHHHCGILAWEGLSFLLLRLRHCMLGNYHLILPVLTRSPSCFYYFFGRPVTIQNVQDLVPGDDRLVTQLPVLDPYHFTVSVIVGGCPHVWLLPNCVTISISST